MTFATNRRASTRHELVNHPTILQIMDLTGQAITRAKLLNISLGGALILTDEALKLKQPHQVRLENSSAHGWIMAEPVRFGRSKEVGIRFRCPGPRDFLLASLGIGSRRVANSEAETPFLNEVRSEESAPLEYAR